MQDEPDNKKENQHMNRSIILKRGGIIVGIIVLAILGNTLLTKTGPKTKKERPPRPVPPVEVMELTKTSEPIIQHVMGTIIPAQQLEIKPQVSGKIEKISPEFIPGGYFKAGSVMMELERTDYELAVTQMESQLTEAEYLLTTEKGHQSVAKREWELLGDDATASDLDRELALRKPHLKRAEAGVKAAKAKLRQAQINLERTFVRAPFNAIINAKSVDVGTQVSPQTTLAVLTGTDEYWARASVPVDRLQWISAPDKEKKKGSKVVIYSNKEKKITDGYVVKILGDLEPQGRMARVLISIHNPPREKILLGAFVHMEIIGETIENIVKIPRSALRENSRIWIADANSELDIRTADILWRNNENVLLKNKFEESDLLVTSDLPIPAKGMKLTVRKEKGEKTQEIKSHE
jgi:RND family efflux transporter MFP subunit